MKQTGLIILAFTNLMLLSAQSGGWRNYEIYQPKIERGYVVEAALDGLAYNHCPTVMWFRDRWFCAWNGNEKPDESTAGHQIWISTSKNSTEW